MGRLLWQAGQPLRKAVREVFAVAEFEVGQTPDGAPYDVLVTLGEGKWLLIVVTSATGSVTKASSALGRAFDTVQLNKEGDRVVVAANAYRERPASERVGGSARLTRTH